MSSNDVEFVTEEAYRQYKLRDQRERSLAAWLWASLALAFSAVVVSFASHGAAFYVLCTVAFLALVATLGRAVTLPPKP